MSWMQALESQTTHTAPSTADLHLSHPCSTFSHASKLALIAPMGSCHLSAWPHCSSLMRRTSIRDPHAVTSPAPPLHPLQPLQTTGHGAEKSAMTSCSRRGSSLHQSGHPHHICIRQARRQGTSGTAANGKQCTCVLVSRFSTTFQSVTVPAFSGAHARCPTRAPALRSRRAERTICDRDVPGGHYPSCSVLLCMCIRSLLPFWLNPRSVSAHYHPSHDGN